MGLRCIQTGFVFVFVFVFFFAVVGLELRAFTWSTPPAPFL
jgi:hypothetical protein